MFYGNKYDSKLSTTDIAKRVRAEIKAATALPESDPWRLPKGLKVSVRSRYFAGGSSISSAVTAFPSALLNPACVLHTVLFKHERYTFERYTKDGSRVLAVLKGMLDAYNFDGSDLQSDYFNVNFYGSVDVDGKCETLARESLLASLPPDLVPDLQVAIANGDTGIARGVLEERDEGYEVHGPNNARLALQQLLYPPVDVF